MQLLFDWLKLFQHEIQHVVRANLTEGSRILLIQGNILYHVLCSRTYPQFCLLNGGKFYLNLNRRYFIFSPLAANSASYRVLISKHSGRSAEA